MQSFRPLFSGSHLQTIGGQLARSFLKWPFGTKDSLVSVNNDIQLLLRASWHPKGNNQPALILLHGLEGSDASPYVVSTGILAYRHGWHVIRMNMRGCGDSLQLCPRLYNAGLTADLLAVCDWVSRRTPLFAICGFSLGAGLTLLTLAKEKHSLPKELLGAVAICPPLDMSLSANALELKQNWIYSSRFTRSLCSSYRKRQKLSPGHYQLDREIGIQTLREFDNTITAYYSNYQNAENYYQSVSAGPVLKNINHPTLVLASNNDPFIPTNTISHWQRANSVSIEIIEGGGHVGFVGASQAPRNFWIADRALEFLKSIKPMLTDT